MWQDGLDSLRKAWTHRLCEHRVPGFGDEIFLMDVNPRFSAGVAFSLRAGYDMIDNHLRCFTGENILPPPAVADAIYTKGFLEYAISNGENHETRKP